MSFTRIVGIALLLAAALPSGSAWAQAAPVLKSVTVDLPAGDRQFPGGAAADAINNNCTACHTPLIEAITWRTRGSLPYRSFSNSHAPSVEQLSETITSMLGYVCASALSTAVATYLM